MGGSVLSYCREPIHRVFLLLQGTCPGGRCEDESGAIAPAVPQYLCGALGSGRGGRWLGNLWCSCNYCDRGGRGNVSGYRRIGVAARVTGRVALPRDRRCRAGNFPLLISCSRSMNVQRRSRGSATLPRRTPTRRYADTPTRLFPGGAVDWRTINSGVNTIVCTGLAPRRRSSRSSIVHFPIVSIGWETTVKGGSI